MWIAGILDGDERARAGRPGSQHEVAARVDVPSLMLHLSGRESGHAADHLERQTSPASSNNPIVDADQGTRDDEENEKSRGERTTPQFCGSCRWRLARSMSAKLSMPVPPG